MTAQAFALRSASPDRRPSDIPRPLARLAQDAITTATDLSYTSLDSVRSIHSDRTDSPSSADTSQSDSSRDQCSVVPSTDLDNDTDMQASWLENSKPKTERRPGLPLSDGDASSPASIHLRAAPALHPFSSFVHRHEIPRKFLHVSIGFLATHLYMAGVQPSAIHPVLMGVFIPVTLTDVIRHRWDRFNRFYIRMVGPLMRESEINRYNGVIFYLAGTWAVMRFCPKDVGVLSILLLSWCDTAASTFGRLFGRYTPQIRRGKSLAGSLAALVTGVATAAIFWGLIGPRYSRLGFDVGPNAFAFQQRLRFPLPSFMSSVTFPSPVDVSGASSQTAPITTGQPWLTLTGTAAIGVASLFTGLLVSASEAVDLFGLDDNLTIPILCGVGIWGFLSMFG